MQIERLMHELSYHSLSSHKFFAIFFQKNKKHADHHAKKV